MKRWIGLAMVFGFLAVSAPLFAQEEALKKGASATAYEHASDQAIFHRVGDWFATVGKTPEEKEAILMERKAKRAAEKAEKEALKAKRQAEEKTEEAKKEGQAKKKEIEKEVAKQKDKIKGMFK